MEQLSNNRIFDGQQLVYQHHSDCCKTPMRFSIYLPAISKQTPCPALFWLSGLTCTEQNFTVKAGAQRAASELGLIVVAPDTSPRGDIADDPDAYDLGKGAGFYVDATQSPWAENYQMHSYIAAELPTLIQQYFPVDAERFGIFGHSMGGHGALTMHLRYPEVFKSVSAFAPIVAPASVPWGQKVLAEYLGEDQQQWHQYDACKLVRQYQSTAKILIDQGSSDEFLAEQLQPELFTAACHAAGQPMELRMQQGYDHSYYFIASFIEDHLHHHAMSLGS